MTIYHDNINSLDTVLIIVVSGDFSDATPSGLGKWAMGRVLVGGFSNPIVGFLVYNIYGSPAQRLLKATSTNQSSVKGDEQPPTVREEKRSRPFLTFPPYPLVLSLSLSRALALSLSLWFFRLFPWQ